MGNAHPQSRFPGIFFIISLFSDKTKRLFLEIGTERESATETILPGLCVHSYGER